MWKFLKSGLYCVFVLICASSATGADWPQLGNNPQRHNYSSETITPPYDVKWSVSLTSINVRHRIHGVAQVIVGDGKAYIGTKSGVLFAFDAVTGAEEWQYQAGGAILHTAGYENGKVFFAAMDGCIYAVNTSNGSEAWKSSTNRRFGFSNAVLLAESKVFAVDRGGYLYALNQSDGSTAWASAYDAQAKVVQSPAYNSGKVYFGSEDMRIHAVNSSNGSQVWRSNLLPGHTFIDYWPVIHNGEVIVRPMTGLEPRNGTDVNPPDKWNPPIKGMFSVNESNGQLTADIAHYQVLTMSGPTSPPAVAADGLLVVPWKLDFSTAWMAHGWALLDLTTTRDAVDTLEGNISAPDEIMAASVFNDTIIAIHACGCYWGNPFDQNGAFVRSTRTWYQGLGGMGRPDDDGAYWRNNNQAEGANPISGANGLLYHQTYDIIYCLESE